MRSTSKSAKPSMREVSTRNKPSVPKRESKSRREVTSLGDRAMETRELLIAKGKDLFLERGYGGTLVDDIATAAEVSRPAFYSYFPTKADLLLAAGVTARESSNHTFRVLGAVPVNWTLEHLKSWIRLYFSHLDQHAGYMLVWSQAAWQDERLRRIGTRGSMLSADILGEQLLRLGAPKYLDHRILGMSLWAMLDRFWYVWRKTNAPFGGDQVLNELAELFALVLGRPQGKPVS